MPKEPAHRHNGGPLSDDDAGKLLNHVRAIEIIEEQEADLREDKTARRKLAKADGFDLNILAAIIKRRKIGEGETRTADQMVRIYEEALMDEGLLPLEQTRITKSRERTTDEIAEQLHGEPAPDMPERNHVADAARALDETMRRTGATATLSVNGQEIATFGDGGLFD